MNADSFYSKSHSFLPRAIEKIAGRARNDTRTIIALPPKHVDEQTDEEELDDDNLASGEIPSEVPGPVEVEYESDDEAPLASPLAKRKRSANTALKWKKVTPCCNIFSTAGAEERKAKVIDTFADQNPVQIFESIFDKSVLELIFSQTRLYALQKNDHKFTVSSNVLQMFIGILFLSGYNCLARERLYWSLDEDVGVKCVSLCMSRNRFQKIKKYVHFADN